MRGSIPKLACRKRLRSCGSSNGTIQSDGEEKGKGKKMRDMDGKLKNMDTAPVFLDKEGKERLNNNKSEKKTRTDDFKKREKICNEAKYGKASPTSFGEKGKKKLKLACSKKNMQTEVDVKEEEVEIWSDHSESKRRKVSTVSYEWEERRKKLNSGNCGKKIHGNGDDSKGKCEDVIVTPPKTENKNKKTANVNGVTKWLQIDVEEDCLDSRIRNGESSATFFEKGKEMKRQNTTNSEKFQRDDKKYEKNAENGHYTVKSRKVSAASYVKEKKKKIPSHHDANKKINGADKNSSLSFSKNKIQNNDGKKSTEPITHVVEKKTRPYESTEMKMHHDPKHKERNAPSSMSKEKKTKAPIDRNYEKRKREESNTLLKQVKRMQSDDNKKIHSGKVTEKKCGDVEEKKRNTPISFFKVLTSNNFRELLSIPKAVAPELVDLTNHDVYLEDSEGKFSKIRLSVVDDVLAFRQGWNIFVSDHLITWGEFLLFEYTAKSTFSVRIFGIDSCERLHFDAGRKSEGIRKKEMHTNNDNLIPLDVESEDNENNYCFSGEYPRMKKAESHHLTVDTTEEPKRVEHMVRSGPVPQDTMNGDEAIQQCRTPDISSLCSKEKRVILITVTDSESSIHENDIVKLMTSTADSGTQHVAADKKQHPKRVQNGIPLTHEYDDTLAVMNANQDVCRNYEASGGFRCLEKWRNSIVGDQAAVLDVTGQSKPESTRKTGSKFVVEYGAVGRNPGDESVLPKDTNVCNQPIFTMPINDPPCPESVPTCEHDGTEINHNIDGKGTCAFFELQPAVPIKNPSSPDSISNCGDCRIEVHNCIDGNGTIAELETKMDHLEPMGSILGIQSTHIPVCANNTAARQSADHSILKVDMQFCIHNTTRKWLELPKLLSNSIRGRNQDRNIIMLKDPMKRLWPVLYHENSIFVGFTTGWKPFMAANNLQIGDLCELFREPGHEEPVYSVQITKKW